MNALLLIAAIWLFINSSVLLWLSAMLYKDNR